MVGAKLWKRILNGNSNLPPEIVNEIIKATIIVGPKLTRENDGEFAWKNYATPTAYPFNAFWAEWDADAGWDVDDGPSDGNFLPMGVMVKRVPMTTPEGKNVGASIFCEVAIEVWPGFVEHIGKISVCAMPDGSLVTKKSGEFIGLCWRAGGCDGATDEERSATLMMATRVMLDLLKMLSCKNVGLEAHDNEPKQARRAAKRHGGKPEDYRYHTLVVRPPGAGPHVKGEPLGIMPRHVCRGHFAEYGPEFGKGLLFGKYAGRFYVPPHLKGDKKNGTVEKDYEIRA